MKVVSLILIHLQLGIYVLDKNSVPGLFFILFGPAEEVFVLTESLSWRAFQSFSLFIESKFC